MRAFSSSVSSRIFLRQLVFILFLAAVTAYILSEDLQKGILSFLYPGESQFIHSRVSLLKMTGIHLILTLSATVLSTLIGVSLGLAITRKGGRVFLPLVLRLNSLVQTFPPSAVVILAFPLLGFGWEPTLLALFLYSLFPVLGNSVLAIQGLDQSVLEAADGMGMNGRQRLFLVEWPQALPLILTGIRHAFILNLGTASIGAVIGAGGLGTIIISGLTLQNSALVFSGTLVTVALALLGNQFFRWMEGSPLSRNQKSFKE